MLLTKLPKKKQGISIKPEQGRLSEDEIARMVKEAEEHAEEDKLVKEKLKARSALENYAYQLKSYLEDTKKAGKLSAKAKKELQMKVEETIEFLDSESKDGSKDDIDEAHSELEVLAGPAIKKMFGKKGEHGEL